MTFAPSLGLFPFFRSYLVTLRQDRVSLLLLLYFTITPWKPVCFLLKDRKGVDLLGRDSGEELGGTEEEETLTYTMCVGNLVSIKRKKKIIH